MKRWFRYLLPASLVFLAVALYKADYLAVPRVHSPAALAGSVACLVAGLIADAFAWRTILRKSGFPAGIGESIAAVGLSAFAKYIPGKVWAVMGRAAYLAERRSYSLAHVTAASLTWQLAVLWLGLIFGGAGLLFLHAPAVWGWLVLAMWLVVTSVVFSNVAQIAAARVCRKLFSKDIEFPRTTPREILNSLPWFFVVWGLLSVGFYLLVAAISGSEIPPSVGLGLPLATTVGLVAFIAPGGIGVREGVIVGYLAIAGFAVPEATAVSLAARLWFVTGEVLIFLTGLVMSSVLKNTHKREASG